MRLGSSFLYIPRELDVETIGSSWVTDVFKLVAVLRDLFCSEVKRLGNVVILEDIFVKLPGMLVPKPVEHRCVGEALDVLDEVGMVKHDVVVAKALLANVLECGLNLVKDNLAVLGTGSYEPNLLLGLVLLPLSITLGGLLNDGLGLKLAKFGGGNHGW